MAEREVYRIADLLVLLACSRATLARYRRVPGFPRPLPLPGAPRWSKDAIGEWLFSRTDARFNPMRRAS